MNPELSLQIIQSSSTRFPLYLSVWQAANPAPCSLCCTPWNFSHKAYLKIPPISNDPSLSPEPRLPKTTDEGHADPGSGRGLIGDTCFRGRQEVLPYINTSCSWMCLQETEYGRSIYHPCFGNTISKYRVEVLIEQRSGANFTPHLTLKGYAASTCYVDHNSHLNS